MSAAGPSAPAASPAVVNVHLEVSHSVNGVNVDRPDRDDRNMSSQLQQRIQALEADCEAKSAKILSLKAELTSLRAENTSLLDETTSLREQVQSTVRTVPWKDATLFCSETASGSRFHMSKKCAGGSGARELTHCRTCVR
jgi:hypothetical protein